MGCLNMEWLEETAPILAEFQDQDQGRAKFRGGRFGRQVQRIQKPAFFSQRNLTDQQKLSIWKSISRDDYQFFIRKLESKQVQYNVEVGLQGSFWTFGHLCARWNAKKCTEFYMLFVYKNFGQDQYCNTLAVVQKQKNDILMIAAMFQSVQVVDLLLKYGGAPIWHSDKYGRNALIMLSATGLNAQASKIEQFNMKGLDTIPIDKVRLSYIPSGKLSNQMIQQQLEKKRKQMQTQRLGIQEQLNNTQNQQEKLRYQQELDRIKAQQQKKLLADKLALQNKLKAELAQKQRLAKQKLAEQEAKKKQIEAIQNQTNFPVTQFPAALQPVLINCYKTNQPFVDNQFPPVAASITTNPKADAAIRRAVFVRVSKIFKTECVLFDKIDPKDIQQGALGICYYLSTLSSLAQNSQRIKRLFKTKEISYIGAYCLTFYVHGKRTDIVIDDNVPVTPDSFQPIFCRPLGNQIWTLLLQKAWVKNFGNYTNSEGMAPEQMIGDVTGAPAEGFWLKNYTDDDLFLRINGYSLNKYLMVLSSKSSPVKGMVAGHAYSLLQTFNFPGIKLYKIRNPWGSFQFQGKYGDKSSNWTQQMKNAVGFQSKDDGIFFMSHDQIKQGFQYLSVGFINDAAIRTQLQFTSKPSQNIFFKFVLNQKAQVCVDLIQRNARYLKDPSYKYSPCDFQIFNNQYFTGGQQQGTIFGGKNIHMNQQVFQSLNAGTYYIRLKMLWPSSVNQAVLCGYSSQRIDIKGCSQQQALKVWQKSLIAESIKQEASQFSPGVTCYNKWLNSYLTFVIKNQSQKSATVVFGFDQSKFVNLKLGYKIKEYNHSITVPSKSQGIFTLEKVKLNVETSAGDYSVQVS